MRRKRFLAVEALEDRLCLSFTLPTPTVISLPTTGAWTGSDPFYGSPIFADLKGDGNQELLVEESGGRLAAFQAGQTTPYITYTAPPMANGQIGNIQATPVVVNVPNIGPVIVAALGRDQTANTVNDGRVVAFNARTGALLWKAPVSTSLPAGSTYTQTGVTGALTIGYLENNAQPDVIVDSFSHLVSAINVGTGKVLWQYNNDDTVEAGAVVADLYGDGKQEVIYASGISPSSYYPAGGYITILNQDGSLDRRIYVPGNIFGSPVVADLLGDGRKEIIVAPNDYFDTAHPGYTPTAAFKAAANRVYAFFPDGTTVPGWPYHTTSNDAIDAATWKEPIAADLYGNGQNEIIDIDRLGVLHVILPNGQDATGFAGGKTLVGGIGPGGGVGNDTWTSAIVAPIDGSGQQDIVASSNYGFEAFGPSGNLIFSTTAPNDTPDGIPNIDLNAPAYGQFTPSSAPVLVFASAYGDAPGEPQTVSIYQLQSPPTGVTAAWPMLRKTATGQAVALSTTFETAVITRTYKALFLRAPFQNEIDYYLPELMSLTYTQYDLAAALAKAAEGVRNFPGLLNVSDADTLAKATTLYNALGIATIPADSQAAILYDAHRGRTYDALANLIVGSDGNYAATSYIAPWAASIYRDIFSINATPQQIASVVTAVDTGTSMGDVVKGLLNGPDARKGYVMSQLEKYLGLTPAAAAAAAAPHVNYTSRENVVIAIVTGAAFYKSVGSNLTNFVNAAYQDIDGFHDSSDTTNWVNMIQSGKSTPYALVNALVHNAAYYNGFVVSSLYQFLPTPAAGVLRNLNGSSTPTNPNPSLVTAYTNQLVAGTTTQEVVLASMMTSAQYISNSTYYRGIYVSPGIRV